MIPIPLSDLDPDLDYVITMDRELRPSTGIEDEKTCRYWIPVDHRPTKGTWYLYPRYDDLLAKRSPTYSTCIRGHEVRCERITDSIASSVPFTTYRQPCCAYLDTPRASNEYALCCRPVPRTPPRGYRWTHALETPPDTAKVIRWNGLHWAGISGNPMTPWGRTAIRLSDETVIGGKRFLPHDPKKPIPVNRNTRLCLLLKGDLDNSFGFTDIYDPLITRPENWNHTSSTPAEHVLAYHPPE